MKKVRFDLTNRYKYVTIKMVVCIAYEKSGLVLSRSVPFFGSNLFVRFFRSYAENLFDFDSDRIFDTINRKEGMHACEKV